MKNEKQTISIGAIFGIVIGTTIVATLAVITAVGAVAYIIYDKYRKLSSTCFETGSLEELEDDMSDEIYDDDNVDTVLVDAENSANQREKIIRRKAKNQKKQ